MSINMLPKVLIFIDWFVPAYKAGGPIQSVFNIIKQKCSTHNFYVVTSDRDIDGPLEILTSELNVWLNKGDYSILYLDRAHQNRKVYKEIFKGRNYDVVYLNSLFSLRFTILPLSVIDKNAYQVILAPRGMLGKGALDLKPFKKKIFLKLFKFFGYHRKLTWHATAETEKKEIEESLGKNLNIVVALNLSKKNPKGYFEKAKEADNLNVFFLSRISIKKNLNLVIESLTSVSSKHKIKFTVIGPTEDKDYWNECEILLNRLPNHISFTIMGAIPNDTLTSVLKEQHLLFLPTRHENFGHVIVESWQNGCLTLISDQTPWVDLERRRVGAIVTLAEKRRFVDKLEMFSSMTKEEFNDWSNCARTYARGITEDIKLLKKYDEMFSRV